MHWRSFAQFWAENAPKRHKDLDIGIEKQPPGLHLLRAVLDRLLAARSGHGDFAEYHERFKHDDALLTCSCRLRKELSHFYSCREGRKATAHPWGQQPVADVSPKRQDSLHTRIGWENRNSVHPSADVTKMLNA